MSPATKKPNMMQDAARFWSDHLIAETDKFGELIPSSPTQLLSGFLGGGPSEPFYRGGYRLTDECREFRVFQVHGPDGIFIVERNFEIQRAYLKSRMRVNGDTPKNEGRWIRRVALADGLENLARHAKENRDALEAVADTAQISNAEAREANKHGSPNTTLTKLAGTIGLEIIKALDSSDPSQSIKELTSSFQLALQALARSANRLDDRRLGSRPRPHDLISMAEGIFLQSRERPTKSHVISLLAHLELTIRGKNSAADWRQLFMLAGLSDLPD